MHCVSQITIFIHVVQRILARGTNQENPQKELDSPIIPSSSNSYEQHFNEFLPAFSP